MLKDRCRMIGRLRGSFANVDCQLCPVHPGQFSKAFTVCQLQLVLAANLHFLDWIMVTVDNRASRFPRSDIRHHADSLDIHQPSNGLWLNEQVFLWQIAQPEVLPPSRLVFAAMPVEEVREQPPGVLLVPLVN